MPSLAAARHPASWTLRAKLVASMVALFLLVSIGTGALIVFATSSYLSRQLDNELTQTATRVDDFGRLGRRPGGDDGDDDGPHAALPGGGGSVLRLVVTDGVVATDRGREINWVPVGATTRTLTTQQIAHIESLDIGPRPSTVAFGGDIGTTMFTIDKVIHHARL